MSHMSHMYQPEHFELNMGTCHEHFRPGLNSWRKVHISTPLVCPLLRVAIAPACQSTGCRLSAPGGGSPATFQGCIPLACQPFLVSTCPHRAGVRALLCPPLVCMHWECLWVSCTCTHAQPPHSARTSLHWRSPGPALQRGGRQKLMPLPAHLGLGRVRGGCQGQGSDSALQAGSEGLVTPFALALQAGSAVPERSAPLLAAALVRSCAPLQPLSPCFLQRAGCR
ncbi:hypothetical protein V8C86DRAFT_1356560 [Haematococcus lacustris]